LAVLYGVNTLGAAAGAAITAYLLIGLLGLSNTTRLAAAVNLLVGALVLLFLGRTVAAANDVDADGEEIADQDRAAAPTLGFKAIMAFSFFSGLVALGYEIVWYRLLGCLLHGTVYVFGTVLFFYLCGIGFGSLWATRTIDQGRNMRSFLRAQLGISAYVLGFSMFLGYGSWLPGIKHLISASFFTTFHPAPELAAGYLDLPSLYSAVDIVFWSVVVLGPPTFWMGYGFPSLLREGSRTVGSLGRSIGWLYFANILGSTLGSLLAGFVLIHYLGTERTLQMAVLIGAAMGLAYAVIARRGRDRGNGIAWDGLGVKTTAAAVIVALAALLLFPSDHRLLRAVHLGNQDGVSMVLHEDRSGVVALRKQERVVAFAEEQRVIDGKWWLYIDGSRHGLVEMADDARAIDEAVKMVLRGHPHPRRILSIGLGDGKMCQTALQFGDVAQLTVVELNGNLKNILCQAPVGKAIFDSDKLRYVVDDGRRWLAANPTEKFDVILMWPLHAAHAYSGNLYSQEFLRMLSRHLNERGVLLLRNADAFSTAKTLAAVFSNVVRTDHIAYLASNTPMCFAPSSLDKAGGAIHPEIEADRRTIVEHTGGAPLNQDMRPNSEYYLTYPYTWAICVRLREQVYEEKSASRYHGLFCH
jgi:predicted membrane-bound spermidine synthase